MLKLDMPNNNIISYAITPVFNSQNMTPIMINVIESNVYEMPLGTYRDNSIKMVWNDISKSCEYEDYSQYNATLVNTNNGVFSCLTLPNSSPHCYQMNSQYNIHRLTALPMPSGIDPIMTNYYFNASWSNGQLLYNETTDRVNASKLIQ